MRPRPDQRRRRILNAAVADYLIERSLEGGGNPASTPLPVFAVGDWEELVTSEVGRGEDVIPQQTTVDDIQRFLILYSLVGLS